MMKKVVIWGVVIVLLIFDWLALDDITTGNQLNFYAEYAMLAISLLIFGFLGFAALNKKL
jgi:hypothetical protein